MLYFYLLINPHKDRDVSKVSPEIVNLLIFNLKGKKNFILIPIFKIMFTLFILQSHIYSLCCSSFLKGKLQMHAYRKTLHDFISILITLLQLCLKFLMLLMLKDPHPILYFYSSLTKHIVSDKH